MSSKEIAKTILLAYIDECSEQELIELMLNHCSATDIVAHIKKCYGKDGIRQICEHLKE